MPTEFFYRTLQELSLCWFVRSFSRFSINPRSPTECYAPETKTEKTPVRGIVEDLWFARRRRATASFCGGWWAGELAALWKGTPAYTLTSSTFFPGSRILWRTPTEPEGQVAIHTCLRAATAIDNNGVINMAVARNLCVGRQAKRAPETWHAMGVWGHARFFFFWNLRALKCHFQKPFQVPTWSWWWFFQR